MNKKIEILLNKLLDEIAELKELSIKQNEEIDNLKKQLELVTVVKIEENGEQSTDSYGNLILDEVVSIKNKLKFLVEKAECSKISYESCDNETLENSQEFSLAELKQELIKLAEMMTL